MYSSEMAFQQLPPPDQYKIFCVSCEQWHRQTHPSCGEQPFQAVPTTIDLKRLQTPILAYIGKYTPTLPAEGGQEPSDVRVKCEDNEAEDMSSKSVESDRPDKYLSHHHFVAQAAATAANLFETPEPKRQRKIINVGNSDAPCAAVCRMSEEFNVWTQKYRLYSPERGESAVCTADAFP